MTLFFAEKYSRLFKKHNANVTNEILEALYNYDWPGNVRELENVIEYSMNMVKENENIKLDNLPKKILQVQQEKDNRSSLYLEDVEREYIEKALTLYIDDPDRKQKAAKELGIGIATLYRKIKKYELK